VRIVSGFVHRPGAHCGSTALRDLAESCAGVELSEAICFGLGAGLGFAYMAGPALSPSHGFCGRAPYLEHHFFSHLGVPFAWHNAPLEWEELSSYVDRDVPILALTDLYYLDYYASTVHFGGHAVVVAGYLPPGEEAGGAPASREYGVVQPKGGGVTGAGQNPQGLDGSVEEGKVLLADTAWPELQQVPYTRFRQAMHSLAPPFPVDGQWTPIPAFQVASRILPEAIRAALATCARCYLHTPPPPELARLGVEHFGISGLRAMSASLPAWMDAPDFSWCCRFAYQMIEKRGTGGSAFRRMYAAFLREARALVPEIPPTAVAEMERAASLWSEAATLFRQLADTAPGPRGPTEVAAGLRRLSGILLEAASHEEEAFHLLATV